MVKVKRRRGPTPKSKTNAVTIERASRIARVLEFRRQGWTLEQIAESEGVVKSRIHKMISDALTSMTFEPAEQIVKLELLRLDEMFVKQYEMAANGNQNAVDKCLAIMERRAKYLGIDAPAKTEEVGELAQAKASLLHKLNVLASRLNPPPTPPMIDVTPAAEP